jgi:predicted GH43/DUF377 family glycosyl hydrolase
MIKIKKEGIILGPTNFVFENKSVFNPGIFQDGQYVHIIYRAVNENYDSCLGYAKLDGPLNLLERYVQPFLSPKYAYEKKGMEDPRISKINDTYYLTYVAHDGKNALIAYYFGKNLFKLQRGGIISPKISYKKAGLLFKNCKLKDDYYFFESFYQQYAGKDVLVWEKDGIMFPEKINNKYALLHRILPDIQVAYFNSFKELKSKEFWVDYLNKLDKHVVLQGKHGFEARHIGGGCPPIKTRHGWLLIYHTAEEANEGRVYRAGCALLNLKDPTKVVARLPYPLLSPTEEYEKQGLVHNVVFPTGTAIFDDRLYIYYGSADTFISCASVKLDSLIKELLRYPNKK